MWLGTAAAIAAGVVGIVIVAGGDDDPSASLTTSTVAPVEPTTSSAEPSPATATPEMTSAPTTTSAPEMTSIPVTTAATTVPPSTAVPTTAAPTAAAPATTAPPAVPAGWRSGDFAARAYPVAWESNWLGVPSPEVADPSAPLPDGRYAVSFVSQPPGALVVDVHRYEACSVLGEPGCLPGPWGPEELGVTDPIGRATIPLDSSLRAVVLGWACGELVSQGSGPDLEALYADLRTGYDAAFWPGLERGADPLAIIDEVRTSPTGGFGPLPPECDDGFSLQWQSGELPPLLVQWPFDWNTDGWVEPASLLVPTMIEVDGSMTTVYLYGGYYS